MFTKDSRTETFLTQMGVEFKYSNNVKFADLRVGWETTNLSRPVPIRDDAVLEYSNLMISGSPAPAAILHITENKLVVLDGVQRLAAAMLVEMSTFSAYLVNCDSDNLVASINVLSNARLQGRPEPAEWTRKRAVEVLVVERGLSIEEVSRMGGWKPAQVKATAIALEWDKLIVDIGGPTLPDSMLQLISNATTLDTVRDCPKPIAAFCNMIKRARLSTDDAAPYVDEFFDRVAKPSKRFEVYSSRLATIKSTPEIEIRIKGRKGGHIPKDMQLRRTLRTAITTLDEMLTDCDSVFYVDEFFKLTRDIEKRLHKFPHKHPEAITVSVPADKWQ